MSFDLQGLCLAPTATVRQAMGVLDRTGLGIVLVVDRRGRLVGVITDGDLRRALLRRGTLATPLRRVVQRQYHAATPDVTRPEAIESMMSLGIEALPIVDRGRRLHGMHLLRQAPDELPNMALILAGGRGERMGEWTEAIPKPLLPLGGRTILSGLVSLLVGAGIRRIAISVGHYAAQIERAIGTGAQFQCQVTYVRETKPLGTGGPLTLLPEIPTHPIVVMNGDLVTNADIRRLLEFHAQWRFKATMAVRRVESRVPFGVIERSGPNGCQVQSISEKPAMAYDANAGIYVISPELLPIIPHDVDYPITNLFAHCLRSGVPVGAYSLTEEWSDVGLPHEYLRYARLGRLA